MTPKQENIVHLISHHTTSDIINTWCERIYAFNIDQGWYSDPTTGNRIERNVGEMLMLAVSELAEGMEGYRKNLMDNHLPHRKMIEVELADVLIRVFDTAGYLGLDLGGAFTEKFRYNAMREDHKIENRAKHDGKKF